MMCNRWIISNVNISFFTIELFDVKSSLKTQRDCWLSNIAKIFRTSEKNEISIKSIFWQIERFISLPPKQKGYLYKSILNLIFKKNEDKKIDTEYKWKKWLKQNQKISSKKVDFQIDLLFAFLSSTYHVNA